MKKINQSSVELFFDFVGIDNSYMNLSIINGEEVIEVSPQDKQKVILSIEFPTEIILDISGKNMNVDTVVNEAGKIILDKHISLTKIIVDRVVVPDYFLQKWPQVNDITTPYFGFNGSVKLRFNEPNSFYWLLKTKQ